MKKFFRWACLAAGVIAVTSIGLLFWARHRYPPHRIRHMVADRLGARLGRKVEIVDARLSFVGGIELKGVRISEAPDFSAGTFIDVDRIRVLPRLLPLWSRRIIVRSIDLAGPRIMIHRSADGLFNFSDLLSSVTSPPTNAAPSPAIGGTAAPGRAPWSTFLVTRATLSGGEVSYKDDALAMTALLRSFDARLSGFSLTDPFGLRLKADLEILQGKNDWKGPLSLQSRLSLDGTRPLVLDNLHLGLGASSLDLAGNVTLLPSPSADLTLTLLSLASTDVARFLPLPDPLSRGRLSGRWIIRASTSRISADGTFAAQSSLLDGAGSLSLESDGTHHEILLSPKSIRLGETPFAPRLSGSGPLSGQWKIVMSSAQWEIEGELAADSAIASYDGWLRKRPGTPFTLTGSVKGARAKPPAIALDLRVPELDVSPNGPWPKDLSLSGKMGLTAEIQGSPHDLSFDVSADGQSLDTAYGSSFRKPTASALVLSAMGRLKNEKGLELTSTTIHTAAGDLEVRGTVGDLMNERTLNLAVKGKFSDLSRLKNILPPLTDYRLRGRSTIDATVLGPADGPDIKGRILLSDTAITPLPGVVLSALNGPVNFSRGQAGSEGLHGEAFGFPFSLKGKIEHFDRPVITLDGDWERLEIEKVLKVFSPATVPPTRPEAPHKRDSSAAPIAQAAGVFRIAEITHPHYLGRDFLFQWNFTNVGPNLSVLSGTATVTAANGEIKDVPVAKKINKLLAREGSDITYKKLAGTFLVTQGVAEVQSFTMDSDQTDFSAQGRVHLGDLESDLRLKLKLPPGSVRGSVGNWITADDGRPTIEAALKGPLGDPKVKVDYRDTVRRAAQDIFKKTLGGWKGKPDRDPTSGEKDSSTEKVSPAPSDLGKNIEDLGRRSLEKIFKK